MYWDNKEMTVFVDGDNNGVSDICASRTWRALKMPALTGRAFGMSKGYVKKIPKTSEAVVNGSHPWHRVICESECKVYLRKIMFYVIDYRRSVDGRPITC